MWSHRLVRDKDSKLHFGFVLLREFESRVSGIVDIINTGDTVDDMRHLARQLLSACDKGIIGEDGEDPDFEDEDEEDRLSDYYTEADEAADWFEAVAAGRAASEI
jgi:hypothetical protein